MLLTTSLKNKNDQILIADTKALVAQERRVLSDFLHHLREIENRKLYLKRGYPSLFAFLTQELQYSESAAGRRIQAMRLIKDVPEVEAQVKAGKISLSVASQMQSFFRRANQKRQSERQAPISPKEKLQWVSQLAGTSSRQCERKLVQISPETALPRERVRPLTPEKTQIQFLADGDLMKKIQRLKELTSHQNSEGKLEKLFTKAVDLALEKLDPERKELRRQARRQRKENIAPQKSDKQSPIASDQSEHPKDLVPVKKPLHHHSNQQNSSFGSLHARALPTSKVSSSEVKAALVTRSAKKKPNRHIPSALRDRVWGRDGGQCQHVDPLSGRKCASRHLVQVDHKYAFSWVPEHSEENLRLLCGSHNRLRWEEYERSLADAGS